MKIKSMSTLLSTSKKAKNAWVSHSLSFLYLLKILKRKLFQKYIIVDLVFDHKYRQKDYSLIIFFQEIFHISFVMLHHYTSFHIMCLFFQAAQSNPTSRTELLL